MTDEPNPNDLLLFTPVPAQRITRAGWSPTVQREFIRALAQTGVVAAAARCVGRAPRSAYQLRARAGAESFARAWDWALEIAIDAARGRIFAAALAPERIPILYRGQIVGWRERYDPRLDLAALRLITADRAVPPRRVAHRERLAAPRRPKPVAACVDPVPATPAHAGVRLL